MLPTLADIGEHGVIELVSRRIRETWPNPSDVLVGVGDDAAVLSGAQPIVVCTDAVVEGVHFRHQWSHGADVGVKLAARNFIDIAVMGAQPSALLLSLTAPADTTLLWLEDFLSGLIAECLRAGAVLVGGDTTAGFGLVATATAIGRVGERVVTRGGAAPGDVVTLAGRPGRAAAGLAALIHGHASDVDDALVAAQVRPQPDYQAAAEAAHTATAMIDSSDGVVADFAHIARASNVVINLQSDLLAHDDAVNDAAAMLGCSARQWQFGGGEDHLVLATFPAASAVPTGFTTIGVVSKVVDDSTAMVLVDGKPWLGKSGYEHFRSGSN